MSKVLLITGDQPRHRFLAQSLADAGLLTALIVQAREEHVPQPPEGLDDNLARLFMMHFEQRREAEHELLSKFPDVVSGLETLQIRGDTLNGEGVVRFVQQAAPDLTLTYGIGLLARETFSRFTGAVWNIHGGLSPWYRGVITHFWPSYLLEPQMTGMTVHELTGKIDGGPIVHQCLAPLMRGDGIHQLACRAVRQIAAELPRLVQLHREGRLTPAALQPTAGKLWLARDWQPAHLRLIYEVFGNRVIDHYLDGRFALREPQLVRQW